MLNYCFYFSQKVLPQTRQLLLEGALTEETVLNHVTKIMSLIRECNVVLRWFMLHTAALSSSNYLYILFIQ
jgi:WASH complex subunit strumpellin